MDKITVRRTGNLFSFSSSEYEVTYPDGSVGTVWSPPWHEMDDDEEDKEALRFAGELYAKGEHLQKREYPCQPLTNCP